MSTDQHPQIYVGIKNILRKDSLIQSLSVKTIQCDAKSESESNAWSILYRPAVFSHPYKPRNRKLLLLNYVVNTTEVQEVYITKTIPVFPTS